MKTREVLEECRLESVCSQAVADSAEDQRELRQAALATFHKVIKGGLLKGSVAK